MVAAFAAAFLFVVQTTFGAFAFGPGPSPAPVDGFGNVICTHDGAAELPDGNQPLKHMPTCCALGCSMGSPALEAPPDTAAVPTRLFFQTVVYLPLKPACFSTVPDRSSSNPRAPPAA